MNTIGARMTKLGRWYVANSGYIKSAGNGKAWLSAEAEGKTVCRELPLSADACAKLTELIGKSVDTLKSYQHHNHQDGYDVYTKYTHCILIP